MLRIIRIYDPLALRPSVAAACRAMIICLCHRVSDRDLRHHAGACTEFEELQVCTGAGTGCGQCVGHARAIFEHTRAGRAAERPVAWHASLAAVAA